MVTFTRSDDTNYEQDNSETWKPKKGSPTAILGEVIERKTITREDESEVELIKLETTEGNRWTIWASPVDLRKRVTEDDPQPGDTWGVELQDPKPLGGGKSMDRYGSYHKPAQGKAATKTKAPKGYAVASGADAHFEANDDEPF